MLRVGLTGSIGSGKSAVSSLLAARGAVIVDADLLARESVGQGTQGLREVVATFGADLLDADGSLDRAALGALVFADEDARRRLEAIIHPRVRARAAELEAAAAPDAVVVHDIPLLVETGQAQSFHVVVVVDVPAQTAVSRLEARGMSEQEAESRLRAQASREDRIAAADVVIDNSGTLAELEHRVGELWEDLSSRAG
ncbi:MAG: Dephospho-CoA kinase [uncultured Nocardioidaceae bacterium]|uniref:Dephospho-CoA kinase n=1 Tax=uncultured Nocardioidaceae bacterium TaxID=253824 RepID=A0A6J4M842_9ACTN|nr:MAG: Dephospho-CoA kinase [uncultured Nocardioidaceae bacterium]